MIFQSPKNNLQDHAGQTVHEQRLPVLLLLLVIVMSAAVRSRLLDLPLERDEGEYAYIAQLILNGFMPYVDAYSMKLPGIYAAYAAAISLFGQTHIGIHTCLLLINATTTVLIFLLGKRLVDVWVGVVAAAGFAFLSLGQFLQGGFANAEHFVLLPMVGGLLLLLKSLDEDRIRFLFYSGLLLGTGFLMKQHGIAFVLLGGTYLLITGLTDRYRLALRLSVFSIGVILPYLLVCLIFIWKETFQQFWFWTFEYARAYTSQIPIRFAWKGFVDRFLPIIGSAPLLWSACLAGMCFGWIDIQVRKRLIFILLFVIFSFLAICPGLYFRPHYFVLILPAISLLLGIAFKVMVVSLSSTRFQDIRYRLSLLTLILLFCISFYQQREYLFTWSTEKICRVTYGGNPFIESLEISAFIREHTNPEDKIAVFGSEPQIYFYSRKAAATGHIYMYPMMERHPYALDMQKQMIREIEEAKPKYIVAVNVYTSWLQRPESHDLIFKWFAVYSKDFYEPVGLVEIYPDGPEYKWGNKIEVKPRSKHWAAVFERKT